MFRIHSVSIASGLWSYLFGYNHVLFDILVINEVLFSHPCKLFLLLHLMVVFAIVLGVLQALVRQYIVILLGDLCIVWLDVCWQ